jgi:hypothetical protein
MRMTGSLKPKVPKTIDQCREEATKSHDEIIKELESGRCYVSDDSAKDAADRKRGVLLHDIKQLEKDIKHYLPGNLFNNRLIWKAMQDVRLSIEAAIREEENHITY